MIEIYLFVHPLCPDCLASEKRMLQMIQANPKKIQFKFLPYLNFKYSQPASSTHKLSPMTLAEWNSFYHNSYHASLDYKAMLLQGKKKGRAFLFTLQELISTGQEAYSKEVVYQVVEKVGGDLAMFIADRASDLVKELYLKDQETAREMNVSSSGSMVIFNYALEDNYGILLEEEPAEELLSELCSARRKNAKLATLGVEQASIRNVFADESNFLKLLEN